MKLPRYPEYKPTGAQWLSEVPSHWEVQPCRALVIERTEKNEGAANQNYLSLMANVGVIPYEEKGDIGNKKPEDLSKCKLVSKGDLVINSMNYGIGSYGLSELSGVCSPVYIVLSPRLDRVKVRFAFRIFENKAFQTYAQSFGNGILEHRAAINWDILKGITVGLPPVDEQVAILQFLDRETGKIDALIAEQEKLLTLLAEKRQATISHAVTKGLNPDVPMKDSGVEWLGEVPEHWVATRLGHLTRQIVDGAHFTPTYVDQGVPFLRVTDITASNLDLSEVKRIPEYEHVELSRRCRPEKGDLLLSKNGTIGIPRVVTWDWDFSIFVSICLIKLGKKLDANFVAYVFQSSTIKIQIEEGVKQSTVINLHLEKIAGFKFPVPPISEQLAIVDYLNAKTIRIDALKSDAEHAIALLKERRTALISAAVTGKIDVRNAVAEEGAA